MKIHHDPQPRFRIRVFEKMNDQNFLKSADAEDTKAAHAIPASLVNRFHITAGDSIMRIALGEQVTPDTGVHYHQAITLSRQDAVTLAQMILKLNQTHDANQSGMVPQINQFQ